MFTLSIVLGCFLGDLEMQKSIHAASPGVFILGLFADLGIFFVINTLINILGALV